MPRHPRPRGPRPHANEDHIAIRIRLLVAVVEVRRHRRAFNPDDLQDVFGEEQADGDEGRDVAEDAACSADGGWEGGEGEAEGAEGGAEGGEEGGSGFGLRDGFGDGRGRVYGAGFGDLWSENSRFRLWWFGQVGHFVRWFFLLRIWGVVVRGSERGVGG